MTEWKQAKHFNQLAISLSWRSELHHCVPSAKRTSPSDEKRIHSQDEISLSHPLASLSTRRAIKASLSDCVESSTGCWFSRSDTPADHCVRRVTAGLSKNVLNCGFTRTQEHAQACKHPCALDPYNSEWCLRIWIKHQADFKAKTSSFYRVHICTDWGTLVRH